MATTLEALEDRMATVERELARLARLVEDPEQVDRPPTDGSLDEWLARLRQKRMSGPSLDEMRRAMGIPPDLEPIGAVALQEMMIEAGVRPEDRLLSSEIIRLREEQRS